MHLLQEQETKVIDMANTGRYTICPFYRTSSGKTITCEDAQRWFSTIKNQGMYMDRFCDTNWETCQFAVELTEMYEMIEQNPDKEEIITLEQYNRSLTRELRKLRSLLGKAEKEIGRLGNGYKSK